MQILYVFVVAMVTVVLSISSVYAKAAVKDEINIAPEPEVGVAASSKGSGKKVDFGSILDDILAPKKNDAAAPEVTASAAPKEGKLDFDTLLADFMSQIKNYKTKDGGFDYRSLLEKYSSSLSDPKIKKQATEFASAMFPDGVDDGKLDNLFNNEDEDLSDFDWDKFTAGDSMGEL